jgi:hypothetical protein
MLTIRDIDLPSPLGGMPSAPIVEVVSLSVGKDGLEVEGYDLGMASAGRQRAYASFIR